MRQRMWRLWIILDLNKRSMLVYERLVWERNAVPTQEKGAHFGGSEAPYSLYADRGGGEGCAPFLRY